MQLKTRQLSVLPLAAVIGALLLSGCERRGPGDAVPRTTSEASTSAPSTAPSEPQRAPDAALQGQPAASHGEAPAGSGTLADARQAARDVGSDMKDAGERASQELKQAGNKASDKMSDALITTAVNAELAKDQSLSATKIDVDTASGRVVLRGSAPSAVAKDRATQLALGVKGVVSVDNQLSVQM